MSGVAAGPTGLVLDVDVPGRVRVSFGAAPGEVVAVLGPNGAGKSTLLSSVAGLLGDVGVVRVGGPDGVEEWSGPGRRPLPVRERRVGLAFQGQRLFPHLSALDNAAFGPRSRGASRSAARGVAREWLDRFGVGDLAGRRPSALSGGQAQRVALARALASDPAVLLLDEPFSGLDVGVAAALRVELTAHLAAYDGVTLLVTHDALDAFALADRVLVLDAGEVAQVGTPDEVAARPRTDHVARLVGLNVLRTGEELRAFRPVDVVVSSAEPAGSARLRWHGLVEGVTRHGDVLRVQVRTDDGPAILADLTPAAVAELAVAPGRSVWLAVKATAVTSYAAGRLPM
ncbi:MAG: ABC transporter ATP-binding protein [Nocardioides sp.]|nr:ABC transporter ATP-binding protein [Nocardioides sp.]